MALKISEHRVPSTAVTGAHRMPKATIVASIMPQLVPVSSSRNHGTINSPSSTTLRVYIFCRPTLSDSSPISGIITVATSAPRVTDSSACDF